MSSIKSTGAPNPPQVGDQLQHLTSTNGKTSAINNHEKINSPSDQDHFELLRQTEEELRICREQLEAMQSNLLASDKQRELLFMDLPVPMYATDPQGKIIRFNTAAATLWEREPEIGKDEYNGATNLFDQDGNPLPHSESPTALAIREKKPIKNVELLIELPDGRKRNILSNPYPILDPQGNVVACVTTFVDISDRKKAEEAIKESEATLRTILENTKDSYVLYDKERKVVAFNQAAKDQYFDLNGTHLKINKFLHELTPSDRHKFAEQVFSRCFNGETFELNVNRIMHNGIERWFRSSYHPIKSISGEVISVSVKSSEITDEVNTQSLIKESEANLRALFDNAKDGFVLLSPDEKILAFNYAASDLYKKIYGKMLVIGKFAHEVLGSQMGTYVHLAYMKVLAGESIERKSKQKAIDGNEYWLRGFYNPVKSPDGQIIGICMGIADITNEVEANAHSAQLAAIVESSADAIIGKTLEGIVTSWNAAAERVFGYSENEMIGQSITKLIPKDHLDEEAEILRKVKAGERIEHFETIRMTKNGELRNISLTISPLRNNDGEVIGASKTARDITEQKLLLEQVQESEIRFRTVANTAPVLIWMSGTDKLCNFFNKGWLEFTGRTIEQELGNGWADGVHPDDLGKCLDIYIDSFDAHKEFTMEYRLKRYDGEYRWLSDNGVPRFSPDGQFLGFIGSCIDVTSRKIAGELLEKEVRERTVELTNKNEELTQQKNFMETVLDSSIDQICVYDKEMRFLAGNKTFLKESNLKADDIIGKAFLEVFPSLHDSAIYKGLCLAISGQPSQGTWKSVESGHTFTTFFTPPDKNNDIYGAMITAHDNTEIIEFSQKLQELNSALEERNLTLQDKNDEVQQQKEFIETVVDASVDLITVYDTEMRVLSVNKQVEKLLKLKRKDIIGKTYSQLFSGERASETYKNLLRSIAGEETHHVLSPGESGRSFDVFMVPLKHNKKVYAVLVLTHDITEIMNISEQLQITNKTLEEKNTALVRSNSELEQFAYVASHDLQEPLRKIRMFSGRIQENPDDLDEATLAYLKKIIKSSDRMSDLIKDILQYSRLSNLRTTFQRTNLSTLVESVLTDYDLITEEKKAQVIIEKLPIIDGIPQKLSQLFSNLLNNSLKFSRDGVAPKITITSSLLPIEEIRKRKLDESTPYYEIIFKDNGIGFNMAFAEKIFIIFQRLNDRSEFEGTGIGLALCRKIAALHGGEIYAESKEGEGAEFHIILPEKKTNIF